MFLGELLVPVDLVRQVFAGIRGPANMGDGAAAGGLTPRERGILVSFAKGRPYAGIAKERGSGR